MCNEVLLHKGTGIAESRHFIQEKWWKYHHCKVFLQSKCGYFWLFYPEVMQIKFFYWVET